MPSRKRKIHYLCRNNKIKKESNIALAVKYGDAVAIQKKENTLSLQRQYHQSKRSAVAVAIENNDEVAIAKKKIAIKI